MSRLFIVAAMLVAAAPADAQNEGMQAGSWGGEAASGPTASLLRFRSTTSAWVFGVSASFLEQKTQQVSVITGETTEQTQDTFLTSLKAGFRRYSDPQAQVRRYTTISGLLGYERSSIGKGWRYGAAGEVGAAYFFNTHASLGLAGEVTAQFIDTSNGGSFIGDRSSLSVAFSGFRLVGGVYF